MNTQKLIKILLSLAVTALFVLTAASSEAATCSVSAERPAINNFDIANYGSPTGTDKWWTSHGAMGQTFTVGDLGATLNSITYEIQDNQSAEITKTWAIRVCTINKVVIDDPSTWILNVIHTETATQDTVQWIGADKAASTGVDAAPFMTWSLDSPVILSANTEYAIDVGLTDSSSGWQSGIPYIKLTGNDYAGGTRYISGTSGVGDSSLGSASGDRVFHVDLTSADPASPTVDAGGDWATWIGEPVMIDATATAVDPNNVGVTLVYNWTYDPIVGFDIAISDPAVEDPTVTVNRVPVWREAPVLNPSFEERESFDPFAEGDDKYIQWALEYWRYLEVDNNGGPVRIWNPGVQGVDETTQGAWDVGFGGDMPDGKYGIVVYTRYNDDEMEDIRPVRDYEAAVQLLDEPFDPDATYELSVKVGRLPEGPGEGGSYNYLWDAGEDGIAGTDDDSAVPGWNGYAVQLAVGGENVGGSTYAGHVIGGTVVAEDYNTLTVSPNGFVTATVTYTPGSASEELAGLPLQVRLCALEDPADHSTTSYAAFDDVTLMTDAAPQLEPVNLTLTVNNEGSTTAISKDKVKIELYETACALTQELEPGNLEITDLNEDCITDLQDFAVLAADWISNYALTAAQEKAAQ